LGQFIREKINESLQIMCKTREIVVKIETRLKQGLGSEVFLDENTKLKVRRLIENLCRILAPFV